MAKNDNIMGRLTYIGVKTKKLMKRRVITEGNYVEVEGGR